MYYTSPEVYEFISKQTNDPIVERKTCRVSGQAFAIYQSDLDFYDKISPTFDGKKFAIPTPTLCPEERQRRRLLFRNERKLYRRMCDATNKPIISMYSPDKNYKVYDQLVWRGDHRNGLTYGRSPDRSLPFFVQFKQLLQEVPRISTLNINSENSHYSLFSSDLKNCYLIFSALGSEDCYYWHQSNRSRNCIDTSFCYHSELCYEVVDCHRCYQSLFCQNCNDSSSIYFSYNLSSCKNCFSCANLSNREYCVLNKQLTKTEYESFIQNFVWDTSSIEQSKDTLRTLKDTSVHKFAHVLHCDNCVGDYLRDCHNCLYCFDLPKSENAKYIQTWTWLQSCHDCCYTWREAEFCFNCLSAFPGHHQIWCTYCWESSNVYYCDFCFGCQDCFWCVGLRNNQYCVLNEQYTKDEYGKAVAKIIEHMQIPYTDYSTHTGTEVLWGEGVPELGEFFDPSLSPFGYNETVAQEYFPLTREEVLARGYGRQDNTYDTKIPEGADVVRPQTYTDIQWDELKSDDGVLKKVFVCEVSWRPFLLQKAELEFYRKHDVPLPRKHPDVRHEERMNQRSPRELYLRGCDKCSKEMVSVYNWVQKDTESSEYSEKLILNGSGWKGLEQSSDHHVIAHDEMRVYCEECYKDAVYR